MKFKKLVSVLLVGAMAASLLAGCGASAGGEEEAAPAAAGEEAAAEAGSAAEEAAVSSFAGFDETINISMYGLSFFGDAGVPDMIAEVNAISQEAINVTVDWTPMDVATYMEQIGLMLSGGESFDLVLCTAIPVVSFTTMTAQNQLTDITDIIPEYAPEMYELMKDYLPATTVNGATYAVPCYRMYNSTYYLLMRKDILDELGLTEQADAMKTWTDFENLMLAVKDGQGSLPDNMQTNAIMSNTDAAGNVITSQYADVGAEAFADNFCYETLADQQAIIQVDSETDTVINHYATEGYKQSIERVHKWYEEGLVYKDAATCPDTGDTNIKNNIAFASWCLCEYGVETVKSSEIGYPIKAVPVVDLEISTSSGNQWAWAVPVSSENPEAAVAFLNLLYTNPEIENLFVYGVEGKDYEVVDGEAVKTENFEYMCSDFFFGNQFNAYPAQGNGATMREDSLAAMNEAGLSKYYGCTVNTDPIANELTALSTVRQKYVPSLASGIDDPAKIDEMNAEYEKAGLQTVLDYYQSELDAWLAQQ